MHTTLCLLVVAQSTAFTATSKTISNPIAKSSSLFPQPRCHRFQTPSSLTASSTAMTPTDNNNSGGGFLSFKTKYGKLNPFAIYYGITSILLGIPWFVALNICQLVYKLTGYKFDKLRRLPIFFSHVWGTVLMRLTRSFPTIEGKDILDKYFKE